MPPLPGEERIQTVFADVHYYFVAPVPRPTHHRFDKGSYLYIYHNSTRKTTRLEIANNPGTPEQDAFHGNLDSVHLRFSYKFPTLLTLVVDPTDGSPNSATPPSAKDPNEWRLACPDPRDQAQHKYRLNTLDVYFWTTDDSKSIVDTLKRLLSPRQLDILDAPRTAGPESMSPVVQQLESVAISDPAYANGQTRNSQNAAMGALPPPPVMGHSRGSPSTQNANSGRPVSMKSNEAPANFAPMAYNPAAPAAPEPIAHREKTPPPPDAANGTGLASAAYADTQAYHSGQSHGYPGLSSPPHAGHVPYGSPPPPQAPYGSPPVQSTYAPQPTSNYLQHRPSISSTTSHHNSSVPPQSAPAPAVSPLSTTSASSRPGHVSPPQEPKSQFLPPHLQQQQPPLESPSAQLYGGPPQSHHHQPVPHVQPQYADYLQSRPQPLQPPPGGYPQYSYPPQQGHHAEDPGQYNVHQQFYQATPEEENKHKFRRTQTLDEGRKQGRLDQTAVKVDRKVGSFLKKLEKKL